MKKFAQLRKEEAPKLPPYVRQPVVEDDVTINTIEQTKAVKEQPKKRKTIDPADFEKVFGKALPQVQPEPEPEEPQLEEAEIVEVSPPVKLPKAPKIPKVLHPPQKTDVNQNTALVQAIEKLPLEMVNLMRHLPVPVLAPRPPGAWVIDVERDKAGILSRMIAQFHETTEPTTEQ